MLTTDYYAAARHSGMMCRLSSEFGGIQVVSIGGKQVYRARRQVKCKQCRKVSKRGMPCAPSVGGSPCNCGNPYTQALRPKRVYRDGKWVELRGQQDAIQVVG